MTGTQVRGKFLKDKENRLPNTHTLTHTHTHTDTRQSGLDFIISEVRM